jgi:hypothetical protein
MSIASSFSSAPSVPAALLGAELGSLPAREAICFALEMALLDRAPRGILRPWLGWTLVCLARYRARRRQLLPTVLRALRPGRSSGDVNPLGERHRIVAQTRHDITATSLTTGEHFRYRRDARAGFSPDAPLDADAVDARDFARWIESLAVGPASAGVDRSLWALWEPDRFQPAVLPAWRLPEQRLWRWVPSAGAIQALVAMLVEPGLLAAQPEGCIRFAKSLDALARRIELEDFADPSTASQWARHVDDPEVPGANSHRAADVRQAHHDWVLRLARQDGGHLPQRDRLLPLFVAVCHPAEIVWACDAIFDGEGTVSHELVEFLELRVDELPPSHGLVRRLRRLPVTLENALFVVHAIRYLRRARLEPELAAARFAEFGALIGSQANGAATSVVDRYAMLALDWFPDDALEWVRLALRAPSGATVEIVAAYLVALGQSWCRREIASALSDDAPEAWLLNEALMIYDMRAAGRPPARDAGGLAQRVISFESDYVFPMYPDDFGNEVPTVPRR